MKIDILFSDFFNVAEKIIGEYGAFNISLASDLPLFIDPFLLFNSGKKEYQDLHASIIRYLRFLRDKSLAGEVDHGLAYSLYRFGEVKQTWLGFSHFGNKGRGLGEQFAFALDKNFVRLFENYGEEGLTRGAHLEKLCLIKDGVGRDNISDFVTNLIKEYLLAYTEKFARDYLDPAVCDSFLVEKVRFNYQTESWEPSTFFLPRFGGDFVLLSPRDVLTKDETWINRPDLLDQFSFVVGALPDEALRSQVNNYLAKILSSNPTEKERREAAGKALSEYPKLIDYFIKKKEETGELATSLSKRKVEYSEDVYLEKTQQLASLLSRESKFYSIFPSTYEEAMSRVTWLKHVIEDCDGYRLFYKDGEPIGNETDLQIIFVSTWYGTPSDVNREPNNGRGPADFKVSRGGLDKTMVEMKLARNSSLKENLKNQQEIHKRANLTKWGIKVIVYFTLEELQKIRAIVEELGLVDAGNIVLIDARNDNKPSASKA